MAAVTLDLLDVADAFFFVGFAGASESSASAGGGTDFFLLEVVEGVLLVVEADFVEGWADADLEEDLEELDLEAYSGGE